MTVSLEFKQISSYYVCESLKIRENFSIVKYNWFNNENLNQNNACFCGASPRYLWATWEWDWISKVQSQLCMTKIFSSWTIAGRKLWTHWMKLVPLDIVPMVKYLHGWCVVSKSDLDNQLENWRANVEIQLGIICQKYGSLLFITTWCTAKLQLEM